MKYILVIAMDLLLINSYAIAQDSFEGFSTFPNDIAWELEADGTAKFNWNEIEKCADQYPNASDRAICAMLIAARKEGQNDKKISR